LELKIIMLKFCLDISPNPENKYFEILISPSVLQIVFLVWARMLHLKVQNYFLILFI